ncbi:unnamed protein product [Symbiodinium sp. CCMP2592]|nr:unnamed protein product [Symbiodinium sp. CCMP2592]
MLPSCFKSTDRLFDDGCLAGIPIGDARSPGRMVLGRSTGSQTPHSNLPDLHLGISPSMQSTPEVLGARGVAKSPYTWMAKTDHADFGPLYAHGAVMNFEEHMFVIGGEKGGPTGGSFSNEVWKSTNKGQTWEKLPQREGRFSARRGHAAMVDHQGVIFFVLGGFAGHAQLENDCWSSEDGSVWHSLGKAAWSGRHGHAAVMTSQSWIVVLGGHDGSSYLSDVWRIHHPSQPGITSHLRAVWNQVPAKKTWWTARYGHAALVDTKDVIYLLGGFYAEKETGHVQCFNDVWKSTDLGDNWLLVTEYANWSGRYQHAATMTSAGSMFIIGGLSIDLDRLADVWRSEDAGVSWTVVTPAASWPARYEHTALVDHRDTMYVLGGIAEGDAAFADVWYSERTCKDNIRCSNLTECRDGTQKNFEGATNPVCVGICDRRIYDKCGPKEDCRVKHGKQTCVDPCNDKDCDKDQVCEVAPRDEVFPRTGEMLQSATAYCLSCDDAKTKASCGRLRQCHWSTGDEACQMRCSVMDQERLLQPRLQLCSLLCALAAAIISLWSLRDPDACVSFTQEQADAPKKCKALEDYADTSTHLLGFCYLNCGDTEVVIYACSMVFGLLLQSLTVLPTHCSCGDQFLRVTWRVDFTGDLAMLEEDLVHKSSGSWIWRRVQAWTGSQQSSLFDWLEGLLQKQEKMLPLHMKVIHQATVDDAVSTSFVFSHRSCVRGVRCPVVPWSRGDQAHRHAG